jgi:hypothetical protein
MSPAQALQLARSAGIKVKIDGEDLLLEALAPPTAAVLDLLSHHKTGILRMLRPAVDGWSAENWQIFFQERVGILEFDGALPRPQAEQRAFACCIAEWLNRNPVGSMPGCCLGCGGVNRQGDPLLPFGTETSGHAWLHGACWSAWHRARRSEAEMALRALGVSAPKHAESEALIAPVEHGSDFETPCDVRHGQVEERPDGLFLHFCEGCGAWGAFGYGVSLRTGKLGRWYCAAHRPRGAS